MTKKTLVAIAMLSIAGAVEAAAEPLTVRVNDAVGIPGGTVAVILRTYASRPIGQGQLCMSAAPNGPGEVAPLDAVQGSRVFSNVADVTTSLIPELEMDPQAVILQFDSPSITVNASDGPLAVFLVRLSDSVVPGETYDLILDLQNTSLIDGAGRPIPIEARNGTLSIRSPLDPVSVEASAEDVVPGADAIFSVATNEVFGISSGRVGIHYDVSFAAGPPTVTMNPLHGRAEFTTDLSIPGLIIVEFDSPGASLNGIPGDLVELRVPTLDSVPVGTLSPVFLDPGLTIITDAAGQPLLLDFEADFLEFVEAPMIAPGSTSDLRVGRVGDGELQLDWSPDCGTGTGYAIYRGDLSRGYESLAFEPGFCDVSVTSAQIPDGHAEAEFFIVVPFADGLEGHYGFDSDDELRPPAGTVCYPQGALNECDP